MLGPAPLGEQEAALPPASVSDRPELVTIRELSDLGPVARWQTEQFRQHRQLRLVDFEDVRQSQRLLDQLTRIIMLAQIDVENTQSCRGRRMEQTANA